MRKLMTGCAALLLGLGSTAAMAQLGANVGVNAGVGAGAGAGSAGSSLGTAGSGGLSLDTSLPGHPAPGSAGVQAVGTGAAASGKVSADARRSTPGGGH
jgi:hypothetical protein